MNSKVKQFLINNWKTNYMISRGKKYYFDDLLYLFEANNDEIIGAITYYIKNNECEIISLDSINENQGIGTKLINQVILNAKRSHCKRIFLITTNDNINALRFYQKRDFDLVCIYRNALTHSRKLKPEIPLIGLNGIPLKHEIELEITF